VNFAQANLADCYSSGTGITKDPNEAAHLYHLAAAQGNKHAQAILRLKGWRSA